MPESNRRGLIIFGTAIAILVLICIIAYAITGDQGIEERFKKALGQGGEPGEEGEGGGFFGFNIEGNILAYIAILVFLVIVCVLAYLKFRGGHAPPGKR